MDQIDNSKNKNQIYWVVGLVIVAAVILIWTVSARKHAGNSAQNSDQTNESVSGSNESDQGNPNFEADSTQKSPTAKGNVSAQGTLLASDNKALGNLMVDSNHGKIYISTKRDYTSMIGQQVSLAADGTLNKFTFLSLSPLGGAGNNVGLDVGGAPDADLAVDVEKVSFSGNLMSSDNSDRGNYVIVSGSTKVYLQTKHDYTSWIGSEVVLNAKGTLTSFTEATLAKK